MRFFFSVGEPSGDLHAANLIHQLRKLDPQTQVVGFGGPKMQSAGCKVHFDLTELAVMFIAGALRNLRTFFRLIAEADQYFSENEVDAVVLIDYPGFNWWIARKAKKHDIPVFYYGVPQMWAWAPGRIKKIRKFVDFVICKLPFEQNWFKERGCEAHYVGHPFFDQLDSQELDREFIKDFSLKAEKTVLLLPGSRNSELESNLDTLVATALAIRKTRPDSRVVVGCLNEKHRDVALAVCQTADIEVFAGKTQELMTVADACVACSGSVSLELLYHRVPSVIVYKLGLMKMLLPKIFLRCRFITLPNLMMVENIKRTSWRLYNPDAKDAEHVLMPEYLTSRDCSGNISKRILRWLNSETESDRKRGELDQLAARYAKPGATSRAADYIIKNVRKQTVVKSSAA